MKNKKIFNLIFLRSTIYATATSGSLLNEFLKASNPNEHPSQMKYHPTHNITQQDTTSPTQNPIPIQSHSRKNHSAPAELMSKKKKKKNTAVGAPLLIPRTSRVQCISAVQQKEPCISHLRFRPGARGEPRCRRALKGSKQCAVLSLSYSPARRSITRSSSTRIIQVLTFDKVSSRSRM